MSSVPVNDHLAKKKSQDVGTHAEGNMCYLYAKKLLNAIYWYWIGSIIHSPQCTCTCSQNNETKNTDKESLEMVDFSNLEQANNSIHRKESDMKRAINCHFRNHLEKWDQEQKFPWKGALHLLLVVLVTIQGFIFARDNSKFTRFLIGNEEAFDRYFKQTTYNEEGIEKLYKLQDVYTQIALIVDSYYDVSKQAVGSFTYVTEDDVVTNVPPNLTMEIVYYDIGCGKDESNLFPYKSNDLIRYTHVFPHNATEAGQESSDIDDVSCCSTETTHSNCSLQYCYCSVEDQIKCFINKNLNRIDRIVFNFTLSSFFRNKIIEDGSSLHAKFHIKITLVNDQYSSMMVNIEVDAGLRRYCGSFKEGTTIMDIVIMVLLILSSITYLYSLINTYKLAKRLKSHFFEHHFETHLHWRVITTLYNKWYIIMLFNNVLIFVALLLKIISEYKVEISIPLVEAVRILLGIGIFFLWCGLFGMLSHFDSLNELFITIRIAFPRVWRFAVCIFILFIAFVLSGWLVLGPYHPKFQDFGLSAESLYCILNGDDLYTTFEDAHFNSQSLPIRLFSELYLVSFIFIFIYIVLSLFIGIFNQAYESLSDNDSRVAMRQWAEIKQENNPCGAPAAPPGCSPVTNSSICDTDAYIKETEVLTNSDSPTTQNNGHLAHKDAATPLNNQHNIHTVKVDLEPHNATKSKANNMKVKSEGNDLPTQSKSEDDNSLRLIPQ